MAAMYVNSQTILTMWMPLDINNLQEHLAIWQDESQRRWDAKQERLNLTLSRDAPLIL